MWPIIDAAIHYGVVPYIGSGNYGILSSGR